MTYHLGPFVVAEAEQSTGNDPMNCFKAAGQTNVEPGNIQNYTKSVQSFVSLILSACKITAINKNIVRGNGPVKDMAGIWNVMKNANMTRYDRQMILDDINHLLAAAKPGFTKIQQDTLSLCITTEVNSLGPAPNY